VKKTLGIVLLMLINQALFADAVKSGVTFGADYFLSTQGDYFNPAIEAGYRLRTGLGINSKWQFGGDVNVNYFMNKPGVTGVFVGMPVKLAIARQVFIGSWNVNPGFAAGGYFSLLKIGPIGYLGKSADIIAASPFLEIGPTLKNGSHILLIVSYDLIITTSKNSILPMMITAKAGYVF